MPTFTLQRRPCLGDLARGRRHVEQLGGGRRPRRRAGDRPGWRGRPAPRRTASVATGTESGWATQVPSKPSPASRCLSARTRSKRLLVGLLVGAAGDHRRHPAHRVRAAAVAGLHEQLGVGAHERHGHRHLRAVRAARTPAASRKRLMAREDVVPAAGVQPGASGRAARRGSRPSRTPPGSSRSGPWP